MKPKPAKAPEPAAAAKPGDEEPGRPTDDLGTILAGVNIPILLLGGDRRIRCFTPTAGELLHLLPADIGRPVAGIRLGLPDVDELIAATIEREEELNRGVIAHDGRWYLMRMCPYRTREDKIDGVLVSFVDIDALKQSQEALRKQSNFVAAILDVAGQALLVIVLDRQRRIVHFNRACQELTGYSLDEVKGTVKDFLHLPEELSQVNANFNELLEGRQRHDRYYWIARDGRRLLIDWFSSVTRADDGSVEYVIRTGVDVTGQQQADATVRMLMETAAQAILGITNDGRIALVNASAEAMFGYGRQELIGQPLELLIPARFAERHAGHRMEYFQAPRRRPMAIGLELAGLRRDGSEFPVEVSLSHVPTSTGILAVGFVSDITVRKRAEESLRESEARLRTLTAGLLAAQEEERKRLSRDLHDDLIQRMAMLSVGVAELEAGLPESARAIKDRLLSLEASLTEVSDDLKRTAYQLHPSVLEHLGLAAALESYCEDISRQAKIRVHFRQRDVPKAVPEAVALCLYRVTQECLRNVVKHAGVARASVELLGKGRELVLAVIDTGKGFDPAEAGKQGGLGLVSVQERARLVNGTVSIRSRHGDGTRVVIHVPLDGGAS